MRPLSVVIVGGGLAGAEAGGSAAERGLGGGCSWAKKPTATVQRLSPGEHDIPKI